MKIILGVEKTGEITTLHLHSKRPDGLLSGALPDGLLVHVRPCQPSTEFAYRLRIAAGGERYVATGRMSLPYRDLGPPIEDNPRYREMIRDIVNA